MSIEEYSPTEIEIQSLGIGVINSEYLDLTTREYLVVGDISETNEIGLNIGELQTTTITNIDKRDIKYSMIVNNAGIGLNTSRKKFDENFKDKNIYGIYIEKGDIFCDGTIMAKNIKLMNDDGSPYVFDTTNSENIIENLINNINSNLELSRFTQGWNSTIVNSDINKNNIFTESFVNINAGPTDTINNFHPLNIISGPLIDKIEGIQLAIKNTGKTQPYTYIEDGHQINVQEASSIKIGIIGNSNISPAIISTTKDMPLEFHISKFNKEINDTYNDSVTPIYNNAFNYPSMVITKDGNICMGKDYVQEINTNILPKLQVYGDILLDDIYIKDNKDSQKIKNIDDIYIRKLGLTFNPNQIYPGRFESGKYEFDDLTIHNILETSNLIIKDNLQFDKTLNVNDISINKLNIRDTNDSSEIRAPIQFHNEVIINNDFSINNNGSLKINDRRVSALAIENIKVLINNPDGTFTTIDGENLTTDDIQDKIALYYALNSDSGFLIDNSNLAIYGNIGVGIQNDQTYGSNKISINNDDINRENYEIGIFNQGEIFSSIGHYKTSFGDSDKSLIIKTENSGSTNAMHNIYFYAGKTNNDIRNGEDGKNIYPTLSILQNQSIGINTNEILDIETVKLNVNGSLAVEDIYIKTDNTIARALFFVKNEISEETNISSYVITSPYDNNKFFINYNNGEISRNNFLENNKTFNVKGGINVTFTNTLYDGYFENNIKLATFKILKNTDNIDIKTAYTNNNLLIGLDNLSVNSKNEYINTETISKPQLMLRNLSERNYNDTIIRLYKGKTNNDITNTKNKAKYSGIDFCDWEPITGLRDKERWYIYRNYDNTKQTIQNYPGVFEIGYSDNQYHPTKSGLEMMYKRNNNTNAIRQQEVDISQDAQNYYFIFNRPINDTNTNLPTYSQLNNHPTVKVYGDMEVTGTVDCADLKILGRTIRIINDSLEPDETTIITDTVADIENDIEITANKFINKTNYNINTDNNNEFLQNIINNVNKLKTNNIFYYNNDNSIASFTKQYNKYTDISLDFSTIFTHDNDYTVVNKMKLTMEYLGENINTPEQIKNVNPSSLSIRNNMDIRLISFYNDESNSYINIGNNLINNQNIEKIALHIEDTSEYLLQLVNKDISKSPKINFQNKSSGTNSDFWILDGPRNDKTFNIIYGNNLNTLNYPENLYNVMTLSSDKKLGINNTTPLYSIDVLSENNSSCRLINDYNNNIRNDFENYQFNIVNINNSNLNFETTLNLFNNKNISFNLKIGIDSSNLPNYTIKSEYIYDDIKNNENYIKTNNLYNKNLIDIPIIFENEILNYNIDYTDITSNIFDVSNQVIFNDITNSLELYNKLILPSFANSNNNNYEFKINNSFLNNSELQSNIFTNSFNNFNNILLYNKYDIINSSDKLFTSNITNYYTYYDTLDLTSNIHFEFTNYLYKDNIIIDAIEQIYKINIIDEEINNENYKIYFSNIIYYDKDNLTNDTVNIDLIVKENYENEVSLSIPYSIMNINDVKYNMLYDYTLNSKNSYTYNLLTSNYLLNNIFGGSIDNISTNSIEFVEINQNKTINFDYEFNSQLYNINSNIDIKFKFNYEKYDINIHTHYLYTNIVENIPHIILENTLNNNNSKIDGANKIYSTLDGDFKINFENNNNEKKTLINLNKNGNVYIDSGNLYVDKIFVDNVYNKNTGNSIILNNTNNYNEETYVNSFSNLKLNANSNIELTAKQIEFNIFGNNNSNIKIVKTGDYYNSNNKILDIYCNDSIDDKLYNTLSLSKINTTTYLTIGENSAKIGICKNIDEIESTLDINGNIQLSKNNFDIKVPHITLNNYNQNLIYKKYNENLIYSDDGIFKLTSKNSNKKFEKELFRIDENYMNINSDNLLIKNIFVENIYDNNGNALVLGNNNYNNNDFFNFTHDLNLEASNIKLTTSNIDIALKWTNNSYFNINKIRGNSINNILQDNYIENDGIELNDIDSYYYLYILIDIDNNLYIYNTNNKIFKYKIEDNSLTDLNFINSIDKIKISNDYNNFFTIKNNNINVVPVLNIENNYEIKLKLSSGYTNNYPTNSETINIYDNESDQTTYNFNITVSDGNYYFNNLNSKLFLGIGTYHINNIPLLHPIGFVINDTSIFEVISGTIFSENEKTIDGISIVYYTGNIIIEVKADFGTISYSCYYHGYMGGENNLEFQSFGLVNLLDISNSTTNNLYIADNNNILKINLNDGNYISGYEFIANIISNNNLGNIDGILNKDAKIGIISSLVVIETDVSNYILYIADKTNKTIRKVDSSNNSLETISGYVPTSFDNNPRSGTNTGNGYDTRFNNIKKILLINNNEFLLVLDSSALNSRIVIIELSTNYSSTIYEVNNTEIYDINYNNNTIYYLNNDINNKLKQIEIVNIDLYKKENITYNTFNDIFSITSIPYDNINNEYYSRSKYDYSEINGFVTNMSIKSKDEFTYIQFGSDNIGRNARIGISTKPDDNIDLKVNNKIQTFDLDVINKLTVKELSIDIFSINNIDSDKQYIELNKNIYPKNANINFGSELNYYNNFFIKNINISDNLSSVITVNSTGYDLFIKIKNDITKYGNIHINNLYLYDELSDTKSSIIYNNSNLEFNFYNINNPDIIHNFKYDLNDNRLLLNNLTVNEELLLTGDFISTNIYTRNITVENSVITDYLNSVAINVSNILSSNITCYSNLIVNNDINISNNLISSNDIYINSNLYVNQYSFINNLETSNINILDGEASNLIVHNILYASNLIVQGSQTVINTNHYETENLLINNTEADGPSLEINHNNTNNVLDFSINENKFILDKDCKLSLNDIKLNNNITFDGSINNISSNNLNNILNLDKNIIEKFQDSSNYTENVESIVNNSSNIIKDVDNKLNNFISQDFFKENPLHPIIKEFDNYGNLINKYTYNNINNTIFSTYDTSNFYIVLKNDTNNNQKHYQLSVTNNLLTDIMMVAGGGSGKNIDMDYQYDNSINELINTGNILGISLSNNYLFYFRKDATNTFYYAHLNNINTENILVNNIQGNIADFKISKNNKVLLYAIDNILYINHLDNFEINNIQNIVYSNKILKIVIDSNSEYIYLLLLNSTLKIINLNDLFTKNIDFDFTCIDFDISNDNNYLYLLSNNRINIFNIKTDTYLLYLNVTNYKKILIDKYHENFISIDSDNIFVKYNINTNTKQNIDDTNIINIFDIDNNSNFVYYLKNNNLYSKALFDDVYPSPGGAGGLLYRTDAIINQGVYDLYIGNGGINNTDGYNTSGFGVTLYGGEKGKLNDKNIPISGNYKGYLVENNYIIKNNTFENIEYTSDIFNGGTSATNILENNYYDGRDGYNAEFLENDKLNLNLNQYFSGGSGVYPGFKGKGGGTNSRDTYKLLKKDLIADSYSGAGASGGYNRMSSIYPKIKDVYETSEEKIIDIHNEYVNDILEVNILFELPSTIQLIIYNNYKQLTNVNQKYIQINDITLEGEYHIIIDYNLNTEKYDILFKNKNDNSDIIFEYSNNNLDTNTYIDLFAEHSNLNNTQHINIKLNNIKYDNIDSYTLTNNKIANNDISKGGSGIIVMKYNIYKEPITNLQQKIDNRLKLLEENLLFSRINTYDDDNIIIKFFKYENSSLYDNIYIDQSYSGIKIISTKEALNNIVNIKYKYIIKLYAYIFEYYNDIIPNVISKIYTYQTYNDIINFNEFISLSNKFIYINKIELDIFDNVYDFTNKSYYSNLIKNNNIITPSINSIMPLYKEKFIELNELLPYDNNYQLITINDYSKYHVLWSSKEENSKLPINVFNNTDIYGEWQNNTYLDTGFINSTYLADGRRIKIDTDNNYYGEWLFIMLDRKIKLNKIIIDIGEEGTNFIDFKIFGKNINQNDINLIETSEIIETFFDNINYTYEKQNYIYNINTLTDNYYNSIVILFEKIDTDKNTLKIKNINFEAIYKNWEI